MPAGKPSKEHWHVCCHGCRYEALVDAETDAKKEQHAHRDASGHSVSARCVDTET
jgi:hypothetical protein